MNIIVLAGGPSPEAAVSLRSGAAVAAALKTKGHSVQILNPQHGLDEFSEQLKAADVVFPALHGTYGEDGQPQAELEQLGVAYVGSDVTSSQLCFNKWQYRQIVAAQNILIPRGELVDEAAFWKSELIKQPFVLKPFDGGSSIDTHIIRQPDQLDKATLAATFQAHSNMLLEELIEGHEITVGVLGNEALAVIEIIPPEDKEFDYENKYNGATQELIPPKNVSLANQERAQELAVKLHQLCGCRDFSRSDFIVTADNQVYTLETNTIPGMTDQSLLPKAAAAIGLDMPALCDRLVQMALARKN